MLYWADSLITFIDILLEKAFFGGVIYLSTTGTEVQELMNDVSSSHMLEKN